MSNLVKYSLASASKRIFSRLFDSILIIVLSTLILFLFSYDFKNENRIVGWKISISFLIVYLLFFIYFILIPFLTNGYSFFSYLFKIRIYSNCLKDIFLKKFYKNYNLSFFIQLLKRELFLWIIQLTFLLFTSFCFINSNDAKELLLNLINKKYTNIQSIFIVTFSSISGFMWLISFLLFINTMLYSKKRTLIDLFSNTYLIDTKNKNNNSSTNKKTIVKKNKLPGQIDVGEIEKITNKNS